MFTSMKKTFTYESVLFCFFLNTAPTRPKPRSWISYQWIAKRDVTDERDNGGQTAECRGSSREETPQQDSSSLSPPCPSPCWTQRLLRSQGWQAFPLILTDCLNTIASHGFENGCPPPSAPLLRAQRLEPWFPHHDTRIQPSRQTE